jgi:RNA-directed DNA polymerase
MKIIELIAEELNKEQSDVKLYLVNASRKYRVFKIPKRTMGFRIIAQPTKQLKEYQRIFLKNADLPIHQCATAYRSGKSIKDNAFVHRKNPYLLRLDLENFFNSLDTNLFWNIWEKHFTSSPISFDDKRQIEQLLFWRPSRKKSGKLILSVGAPTSPYISNFCFVFFDEMLEKICLEREITYTRYADDLIFSTNQRGNLFNIPKEVEKLLHMNFGKKLILNQGKTIFSSKAHNRHITGLTITNDNKLSIGRERKRYIKHLVHQYVCSSLESEDIEHLRGLLAFVKHVEPSFISSLELKYTTATIEQIIRNTYDHTETRSSN